MTLKDTNKGRKPATKATRRTVAKGTPLDTVSGLTQSLRSLAGQVVGMAGAAVDTSLHAASGLFPHGLVSTKALVKAGVPAWV